MQVFFNIKSLVNAYERGSQLLKGSALNNVEIIENAYLITHQEKIHTYGSMSQLDPKIDLSTGVDCQRKFVIPTFVDSHTHIVYPTSREEEYEDRIKGLSYEDIAKRGGGILNSAAKTKLASEDELFNSASLRVHEVMKMGTGVLEIKSGYGLNLESELKMLRVAKRLKEVFPIIIKTTFLGAHAVPKGVTQKDYVKLVIDEMIPAVAKDNLADYCDVFCDRGFFTEKETDQILEAAAKHSMKGKLHANELDFSGGIQSGVRNRAISVDHLEFTGDEEIALLKDSQTIPTLLPSTAFFLGLEYPPARKMIDAGLPVSLASDYNPGSSPSGNMSFIMSLACIKMRMTPNEAFNAATINAAHALELGHQTGAIIKNKVANFIITEPISNLANLSYSFGRPLIDSVYIKGKRYKNVKSDH